MIDKLKKQVDEVKDKMTDELKEKANSFDAKESMENSKEFLKNQTENLKNMDINEVKKKWNWKAFFFNAYYFAGYGALRKGAILAFVAGLSSMSIIFIFLPFVIAIYAGLKANEELDFKNKFDWKNVGIAIVANIIAILLASLLSGSFSNSNINLVKNGIINLDKSITVGQALDNWDNCQNTNWTSFTTKNGKQVVQFKCEIVGANKFYKFMVNDDFLNKYFDSQKNKKDFDKLSQSWNIKKQTLTFQFVINKKHDRFNLDNVNTKTIWADDKIFSSNPSDNQLSNAYNNKLTYDYDTWNNLPKAAKAKLMIGLSLAFNQLKALSK